MQKEDLIHPSHGSEDLRLKSTLLCIIGRNRVISPQTNYTSILMWDSVSTFKNTPLYEDFNSRVEGRLEPEGVHKPGSQQNSDIKEKHENFIPWILRQGKIRRNL